MERKRVLQHFQQAQAAIGEARAASERDAAAPEELKSRLRELELQAEQSWDVVVQARDESFIQRCVDTMEDISDRAKRACENANVGPKVRIAVMEAHQQLSRLKHEVH